MYIFPHGIWHGTEYHIFKSIVTKLEIPVIATTWLYNYDKQSKAEKHHNGRAGAIVTVESLIDGQNSCQLISWWLTEWLFV